MDMVANHLCRLLGDQYMRERGKGERQNDADAAFKLVQFSLRA